MYMLWKGDIIIVLFVSVNASFSYTFIITVRVVMQCFGDPVTFVLYIKHILKRYSVQSE